MRRTCPNCNDSKGVREIIYCLPDGPLDDGTYEIGGCCISENDPTVCCITCGWEGEFVNNILNTSNN